MERDEVNSIIRDVLCLPDDAEDLGYELIPEWSSASHINIIIALEERLDLVFEPDDIVEMTTVDAILDVIARRK